MIKKVAMFGKLSKLDHINLFANKKGAMFGLDCRALKKQFGELFLASRQSEAPQGANGSCGYFKHGAMFGLDARIALAIFGALSVISGAALYSAIQDSKVTALLTDMQEIGKAWEAYLLDTGQEPPVRDLNPATDNHYSYKMSELVESSVPGWAGPYLPYKTSINPDLIEHPIYKYLTIEKITNADWSSTQWIDAKCDTIGDKCFLWVSISGYDNIPLAKAMDKKIDNGDGPGAGDFRWVPSNPTYRYSLKYIPIKNPNN